MIKTRYKVFIMLFIIMAVFLYFNANEKLVLANNESIKSGVEDIYNKTNCQKDKDRVIVIGDDEEYPPYSFRDENGNPTGFNIELIKAAAEAMGFKVEVKLDKWADIRKELENGDIDAVAGMFRSKEREDKYSFATKHTIASGDIFTTKDKTLKSIDELRGKTVVVQKGEIAGECLRKENLDIKFVEVSTTKEALKLVHNKKYDYAAVLKTTGHYIINKEKYFNLEDNGLTIHNDDYCFAVKKGNEDLIFDINGGLQILKATGEFDEIYDKWLGVYEEKTFYEKLIQHMWLIGSVVTAIILLGLWNITLKMKVSHRTKELVQLNEALNKSQQELLVSNEELEDSLGELSAIEEELRSQYDQLIESENKLRKSEERNRAIVTAIPDIIFVVDENAVFKDCETRDESMLIIPRENFIGKKLCEVLPKEIAEIAGEKIQLALKNNSLEGFKYELDTIEGKKYYELRVAKCRENEVITISRDITFKHIAEKSLEFLSYHDQLTGLYNRRFFEEELKRLDKVENLPLTIFMADVNGLKLINDSFGHTAGDELLKRVGNVISSVCRNKGTVSRIGGDEFVILLPNTDMVGADKILKEIVKLTSVEKVKSINVSMSLGFEIKHCYEEDIFEVLKKAEDFMYKRKLFESPSMRGKTINAIINTLHEKNKREEEHSHRVSKYCKYLGKAMGLPDGEIQELMTVGLLHDIGKVAIDENILNKPGKLNDEEWEDLKRHPEIGYRILSSVNDMAEMAEYVLAHHERWDGKGYPRGLKEKEIPLKSRIIAIADAYDAMTSERAYRSALPKEVAIAELIRNQGIQFDSELVKIFVEDVLKNEDFLKKFNKFLL